MRSNARTQLEKLGLSAAEAQVYFVLVRNGRSLGASAVAAATGVPRTNVYPILNSLLDMGIVQAEAGYGSQYRAVRPKEALPSLILRAREDLAQREHVARELVEHFESFAESSENNGTSEVIQVLRDPRVIAERFERLQLEVERQLDIFVKAPFFAPQGNPAGDNLARRGVRSRALYERAVLEAPDIQPYVAKWISQGEESRVHEGALPHKLAIFDQRHVLMPLVMSDGQGKALSITHPQLATSLGMLFDFLWARGKPLVLAPPRGKRPPASKTRRQARPVPARSRGRRPSRV